MNLPELRALSVATGFPDPDLAAAIAMAESGGDPCARGDPHQDPDCTTRGDVATSFGLWQIHVPAHPEYESADLFDPATNARAAFAISKGGRDWSPWSTFASGAYQAYYSPPGGGGAAGGGTLALSASLGVIVILLAWVIRGDLDARF